MLPSPNRLYITVGSSFFVRHFFVITTYSSVTHAGDTLG
ncbi:Uncharacterised protein [Vibrio cholerae]|nr:Uncharacterised protein [Vibrio cholerae]